MSERIIAKNQQSYGYLMHPFQRYHANKELDKLYGHIMVYDNKHKKGGKSPRLTYEINNYVPKNCDCNRIMACKKNVLFEVSYDLLEKSYEKNGETIVKEIMQLHTIRPIQSYKERRRITAKQAQEVPQATTASEHKDRKTPCEYRVSGHWRYYKKTGKRVWIKPHTRCKGNR